MNTKTILVFKKSINHLTRILLVIISIITIQSSNTFSQTSFNIFVKQSNFTNNLETIYKNVPNTNSQNYLNINENADKNIDYSFYNEINNNESSNYSSSIKGIFTPITGNVRELNKFLKSLKNLNGKIRIAHYGDSIVLGDVITEYLRENFQKRFGGDGLGFLSVKPDDIRMKRSINQTISNDWEVGSITKGNPKKFPIGMSGITGRPNRNSWIQFKTTKFMKTSRSFKIAKVFYGNAGPSSSIQYSFEDRPFKTMKLNSMSGVNQVVLSSKYPVNKLKIKFGGAAGTYIYGISLENGNGIYVDNFPITGNSGVSLIKITKRILKDFNKFMKYKLIIIQFGVNASELSMNLNWYKNKMIRVIKNFKKTLPGVSILLVSAGDKSIKRGSRFITDPRIIKLISTQKKIAEKAQVAFWNVYDVMGGKNSMSKWVNAGPPLALRDYIHMTDLGGKRLGTLLYEALMKEYNKLR